MSIPVEIVASVLLFFFVVGLWLAGRSAARDNKLLLRLREQDYRKRHDLNAQIGHLTEELEVAKKRVIIVQVESITSDLPEAVVELGEMELNLDKCPRCGERHEDLTFTQFEDNYEPLGHFTHWAACPGTDDPILVRIVVTDEAGYLSDSKT